MGGGDQRRPGKARVADARPAPRARPPLHKWAQNNEHRCQRSCHDSQTNRETKGIHAQCRECPEHRPPLEGECSLDPEDVIRRVMRLKTTPHPCVGRSDTTPMSCSPTPRSLDPGGRAPPVGQRVGCGPTIHRYEPAVVDRRQGCSSRTALWMSHSVSSRPTRARRARRPTERAVQPVHACFDRRLPPILPRRAQGLHVCPPPGRSCRYHATGHSWSLVWSVTTSEG